MSHKKESLWCPLCDLPSEECVQPDGYREQGLVEDECVDGHAAHWVTLAERARDEALSNMHTKHEEQP